MPPGLSPWKLYEVLLAFFFWLSVFVGLVSLVVFVLLGVSVYKLAKGPAHARRSLLPVFLLALLAHDAHGESLKIPLGLDLYMPVYAGSREQSALAGQSLAQAAALFRPPPLP